MTDSDEPTHDSRFAVADKQPVSGDKSSDGSRLLAFGRFGAILLSVLGSLVASGMLPGRMRIHWTLGIGSYYGPEFAPTLLVLTVFPVVIGASAISSCWVATMLRRSEEFATLRSYYAITVLSTLAALLLTQGVLIVANL